MIVHEAPGARLAPQVFEVISGLAWLTPLTVIAPSSVSLMSSLNKGTIPLLVIVMV